MGWRWPCVGVEVGGLFVGSVGVGAGAGFGVVGGVGVGSYLLRWC